MTLLFERFHQQGMELVGGMESNTELQYTLASLTYISEVYTRRNQKYWYPSSKSGVNE